MTSPIYKRSADGLVLEADVERYPYMFDCPKPECYYRVACVSLEDAEAQQLIHDCPRGTGTMPAGKSLLEKMWDNLDAEVEKIFTSFPDSEHSKAVALGIASCIALMMNPIFTTTAQISEEAGRRYRAKKAGEEYETPGLGSRRLEMPMDLRRVSTPARPARPTAPPTGAAATPVHSSPERVTSAQRALEGLTEEQRTAIATGLAGGFEAKMLAAAYSVPVSTIQMLAK